MKNWLPNPQTNITKGWLHLLRGHGTIAQHQLQRRGQETISKGARSGPDDIIKLSLAKTLL
jgi:hypothetical protein